MMVMSEVCVGGKEGLNGCFGFPGYEPRTFCVVGLDGFDSIRCTCAMGAGVHVVVAAFEGHC